MPLANIKPASSSSGIVGNSAIRNAPGAYYGTIDPDALVTIGNSIHDFNNRIGTGIDDRFDKFVRNNFKDKEKAEKWASRFTGEDVALLPDIAEDLAIMIGSSAALSPEVGIGLLMAKSGLQNAENFKEAITGKDVETGDELTNKQRAAKGAGAAISTLIYGLPIPAGKLAKAVKGATKIGGEAAKGEAAMKNFLEDQYRAGAKYATDDAAGEATKVLPGETTKALPAPVTESKPGASATAEPVSPRTPASARENAPENVAEKIQSPVTEAQSMPREAGPVSKPYTDRRLPGPATEAQGVPREAGPAIPPTGMQPANTKGYRISPYELDYVLPQTLETPTSGGRFISELYNPLVPVKNPPYKRIVGTTFPGSDSPLHKYGSVQYRNPNGGSIVRYDIDPRDYGIDLLPEGITAEEVLRMGNEWRARNGFAQAAEYLTARPPALNDIPEVVPEIVIPRSEWLADQVPEVAAADISTASKAAAQGAQRTGKAASKPSNPRNNNIPEINNLDEIVTDRAVLDETLLESAEAVETWRAEQKAVLQDYINRARVQLGEDSPEFAQVKKAAQDKWREVEYIANGYRMQNNMGNAMGGFVGALENQGVHIPGVSQATSDVASNSAERLGAEAAEKASAPKASASQKTAQKSKKDTGQQKKSTEDSKSSAEKTNESASDTVDTAPEERVDTRTKAEKRQDVRNIASMSPLSEEIPESVRRSMWDLGANPKYSVINERLESSDAKFAKELNDFIKRNFSSSGRKDYRSAKSKRKEEYAKAREKAGINKRDIMTDKLARKAPEFLAYGSVPALAGGSGFLNAYGENGEDVINAMTGKRDSSGNAPYRAIAGATLATMLFGPKASKVTNKIASRYGSGTYQALDNIMKNDPDAFGRLFSKRILDKSAGIGPSTALPSSFIAATGNSLSDTKFER